MPYTYDANSHTITIPRGDTATLNITVSGGGATNGDMVLFRVRDMQNTAWALTKRAVITNGRAQISLESRDTKRLRIGGKYGWTLGVIVGADIADDGSVSANDASDVVLTAFNELKSFVVAESGVLGIKE